MNNHEFTLEIYATAGCHDLHLMVRPDDNLDDRFDAICQDTGETLWLNGWNFSIEVAE
tara:strand:- start:851 stop:1024 length:174 start_codon:yes stop_codon:yes gene_type:complete